jgi:exodeoxyribonuclease (lambda-induced)
MEQRSPEWLQIRVGKLTASSASAMLAMTKSGPSVQRHDLRMQLACERLTGLSCETPFTPSAAVQRGIDKEPDAIRAYEALTGAVVGRVGFMEAEGHAAGCSPDGVVEGVDGQLGLVEIKCPTTKVHVGYLRAGVIPVTYQPQLTHSLWVAGPEYAYIDFFSFDDRLPVGLQTFVTRQTRDEAMLDLYQVAVEVFLAEVDAEIEALTALQGGL